MEVSDERGRDIPRHEIEYRDKESVNWLKLDSWMFSIKGNSLEGWDTNYVFRRCTR